MGSSPPDVVEANIPSLWQFRGPGKTECHEFGSNQVDLAGVDLEVEKSSVKAPVVSNCAAVEAESVKNVEVEVKACEQAVGLYIFIFTYE